MRLQLSRLHYPVTTLGFGRRIGVWFQGCSIRCPGCVSVDTWDPQQGTSTVAAVLAAIDPWLNEADGMTVSGGEPFEQVDALVALLGAVRSRLNGDILVYTGYERAILETHLPRLSGLIDVLITGRFDARAGQTFVLRGSDNQQMLPLTQLGNARYRDLIDRVGTDTERVLDVAITEDGDFWFAGIPRPGDIPRLRRLLAARGFDVETSQTPPAAEPGAT